MEIGSLYREPERHEQIAFGALEFHDVFKIFSSGPAETVALRGLELRIEPGELVALLGPSGSGKSTALHLAAGLDEPSAGEVRAFGQSLSRLDEAELASYRARQIAIVFQSGNLWNELSARENVELGLRLAGRRRNVAAAADRALAAFGLQRREAQRAGVALRGRAAATRDRGGGGARGAARPRRRADRRARRTQRAGGAARARGGCATSSGAPSSSSPTRRASPTPSTAVIEIRDGTVA